MKGEKKDRRFGDRFVDHYSSSLSYGRKKRSRIRYLNWATELYGCPDDEIETKILQNLSGSEVNESINREVRKAVQKLSFEEKQFIQLFYFEFRSYQEIAGISKRKMYRLERIHQRALGKLRIILADFVKKHFDLNVPEKTNCIICNSPFRLELDKLIRAKKEHETYSRLIKVFRQKYGLVIRTPQVIIGHRKKHMV
jgi:hypothetical protein